VLRVGAAPGAAGGVRERISRGFLREEFFIFRKWALRFARSDAQQSM
jgi:hypothetical protein